MSQSIQTAFFFLFLFVLPFQLRSFINRSYLFILFENSLSVFVPIAKREHNSIFMGTLRIWTPSFEYMAD